MDKYAVMSIVAPIAAPIAPATVLINTLYQSMQSMGVEHNIALVSSVASGAGAEMSGMVAAYAAIQAYRKHKPGHFKVAIIAFGLYVLFMSIGLITGENPAPLIITVFISIIAYLAVAVVEDLFRDTSETIAADTLDIERTKAAASLERARARQMEAGQNAQIVQLSTGQTGQASGGLDEEKILATIAYLKRQPDPKAVSVRDLEAAELGYKKSVASAYKSAALERMK
jgi:hypothetical protein